MLKIQILKKIFFRNRKLALIITCLVSFISISELYATSTSNLPIGKITIYAQLEEEFGSLFELIGADSKVIMGSGFGNSCNTGIKLQRTFSTFVTPEFGPQDKFLVSLPNPFTGSFGTALSYDRDEGLAALPVYHSRNRVYFDDMSQTFIDRNNATLGGPDLTRDITTRDEFVIAQMVEESEQKNLLSSYSNKKGSLLTFIDRSTETYKLIVYSWAEARKTRKMFFFKGDYPLCYGELNGKLIFGTNLGDLCSCEVVNGQIKTIHENKEKGKVSFQFYCIINFYDSILIGHYPSGNAYKYDDKELSLFQEEAPGVKMYGRELQTMALSGGQIYAGIWPWSEIWTFNVNLRAWDFFRRMIASPDFELAKSCGHPYEYFVKNGHFNELGQRVFSLVPYKNKLFASNSSKSGKACAESEISQPDSSKKIPSQELDITAYGKIDIIETPRNYSVFLPKSEIPAHLFVYLIYPTTIEIKYNDVLLGTVQHHIKKENLLEAQILEGKGMFGTLKGKIIRADIETY